MFPILVVDVFQERQKVQDLQQQFEAELSRLRREHEREVEALRRELETAKHQSELQLQQKVCLTDVSRVSNMLPL